MANVIELIIKAVVEGGQDIAKLKDIIDQVSESTQKDVHNIAGVEKATDNLGASIQNLAAKNFGERFFDDLDKARGAVDATIRELEAAGKSTAGLDNLKALLDSIGEGALGGFSAAETNLEQFIKNTAAAAQQLNKSGDEVKEAAADFRDFSLAGDAAVKSVAELQQASATGLNQFLETISNAPKNIADLEQESAAGFNAAMQQLADANEVADKGIKTTRLSVQELDDAIDQLNESLKNTGIDIPTGELRKFTVDAAREGGVGEGVVTNVLGQLAQSTEGLSKDQLEELTRGVINTSQAFKTDFIATAQEAAKVVNGLGDSVKDTTVAIQQLSDPQERTAALAGELNKNFRATGEGAQELGDKAEEGGKGVEALNTAMTSFGAIAGTLNPQLAHLQHLLGSFAETALPIVAITGLIAGLLGLAKEAANVGSELRKTATINGIAVETLSALKVAAEQNDSSLGELSIGLRTFNREIAQAVTQGGAAQKQFIELGITFDQLNDFYTDSESALEAVAKRITETASATERTRLAISYFGRQGRELLPLLKEISEKGLAGLRDEAERAGLIVSNETAAAAKAFNDNLTTLSQTVQGFVFRSMAPFLASFNQFVADNPATVKAIGTLTIAFAGLALAIGAIKVANLIDLGSTIVKIADLGVNALFKLGGAFSGLGLLIAAHPYVAAIVAIGAAIAAITAGFAYFSTSSKYAGQSLDQLANSTTSAKDRLAELERNGNGATKAAQDLRTEIDELGKASKETEDRIKFLSDKLEKIKKLRESPNVTESTKKDILEPEQRATEAALAKVQGPPKKPFEETQQAIRRTSLELDNLIRSGAGSTQKMAELRTQLEALRATFKAQLDEELESLNKQLERLQLNGGSADAIAKVRVEIEKLLALREKTEKPAKESEATKQLGLQIQDLQSQLQKTKTETAQHISEQLLDQSGDINRFLDDVEKHINKLRDIAQKDINLKFDEEVKTVDPAVAARARTAREAIADFQKEEQIRQAIAKVSETQVRLEKDEQAALDARAKATEALANARLATQQQTLERSLPVIPSLDEATRQAQALAAQQRSIIEDSIKANEQRRNAILAEIKDFTDLEDIGGEIPASIKEQKAAVDQINATLETQRAKLVTIDDSVDDIKKKYVDLHQKIDLQIDTTKAQTELDTLQDQLKNLELAKDLGNEVPLRQFLDIASKIDTVQQRILKNQIDQLEVAKQLTIEQIARVRGISEEEAASAREVAAAQAEIDRLRNQAALKATEQQDKKLEDLERKVDQVASDTAKSFTDRLVEGLSQGTLNLKSFFEQTGKTILTDLLQEQIKSGLKPILREQAVAIGEKPADTLGGQFLQQLKFAFGSIFGFDKVRQNQTAQQAAAKDPLAETRDLVAKANSDTASSVKTSVGGAMDKLREAGNVLLDAGTKLKEALTSAFTTKPQQQDLTTTPAGLALESSREQDALNRRDKLESQLGDTNLSEETKAAIGEQIAQLNNELLAIDRDRASRGNQIAQDQATVIKTAATDSAKTLTLSADKITGSGNTLQTAANSLLEAAARLAACGCGTPGAGGGFTGSLQPQAQKPEPEKSLKVDIEPYNPEQKQEVTADIADQAQPLKVIDVTPRQPPATGTISDSVDAAVKSDDEFKDDILSAVQALADEANVGVGGSASTGAGNGFDLSKLLGAGLPTLLLGASALGGKSNILSKLMTVLGAGKSIYEGGKGIFDILNSSFSTNSTTAAVQAWADAANEGVGAANAAAEGTSWLSTIGSWFGFAKGGMAGEDGGAIFSNQLGNMVSTGAIRKFRSGDMIRGATLGILGEEGPEIVARMKPGGAHDGMMGSDKGDIHQNVYIVDQRRPNLGPNDVELIVGDSMDRGRLVGKAVTNVIRRTQKRNN